MKNSKTQHKNQTARKHLRYCILSCISVPILIFTVFTIWYYQPRHYSGNLRFEQSTDSTLDIPAEACSLNGFWNNEKDINTFGQNNILNTGLIKTKNPTTLDIQFELSAQKSFFKPTEFYGKLIINGEEYVSTFSVQNSEEEPWTYPFPKFSSSILDLTAIYVPHDTGNWFQNLKAKLQGEEWIPFFVLKNNQNTKNTIIVNNLQDLFQKESSDDYCITIRAGEYSYDLKK
ncbi:MAG: hypothetical protein K2O03_02705 [Lachnospiraceae bacterium]|nr:hypothetical protein [Lachnospiraceae bacterium]